MGQVSEILDEKGHRVLMIDAGASVLEAVKQMVAANVGSLLVTDNGEIAGVVTERDFLRSVAGDDGEVTGIVSIGDVVKFKSREQSFEIQFLHDYIAAG